MTDTQRTSQPEAIPEGSEIEFSKATVIEADDELEGVAAEYELIERIHGEWGEDWKVLSQSLLKENDRYYDLILIELEDGRRLRYLFDITAFFGKNNALRRQQVSSLLMLLAGISERGD